MKLPWKIKFPEKNMFLVPESPIFNAIFTGFSGKGYAVTKLLSKITNFNIVLARFNCNKELVMNLPWETKFAKKNVFLVPE